LIKKILPLDQHANNFSKILGSLIKPLPARILVGQWNSGLVGIEKIHILKLV